MISIYKIVNPEGLIYIGRTIRPLNIRLSHHIYNAKKSNNKLSKSIIKYGRENHIIELLEVVDNYKEANIKEWNYIIEYDSIKNGLNTYHGLNVTYSINELKDMY